ncbi:MAG TPA: hypothetical protein VIV12_29405, partial [Streptosporangiaceae bacterium]
MVGTRGRTALFARYSLVGTLAGALGSLSAGFPILVARTMGVPLRGVLEAVFLLYAGLAGLALLCYGRLSGGRPVAAGPPAAPLGDSRGIVVRLAALFSLDAFGGGFFVQSLLVVWLHQRFDIPVSAIGAILFAGNTLSAASFLVAVPLSRRFGLINTMVPTGRGAGDRPGDPRSPRHRPGRSGGPRPRAHALRRALRHGERSVVART